MCLVASGAFVQQRVQFMERTIFLGVMGATLAVLVGPANASGGAAEPDLFVPTLAAHVAHVPPADTLRRRVTVGEPLIVTLPDALSDRPVTTYRLVRGPALSWLVDRSLLWRPRPADVGTHALLVHAAFTGTPPDTLTILVDVTP